MTKAVVTKVTKKTNKKATQKDLVPPDLKQCQAEIPNGYSFMTLGGTPGRERCIRVPTVVITEAKPGKDGRQGSMALCNECKAVAFKQLGAEFFKLAPIQAEPSQFAKTAFKKYYATNSATELHETASEAFYAGWNARKAAEFRVLGTTCDHYKDALERIASSRSYKPSDLVDIALNALNLPSKVFT